MLRKKTPPMPVLEKIAESSPNAKEQSGKQIAKRGKIFGTNLMGT